MIPYRDLSLRYKIPLRAVGLMLATAAVIAGTLIYRETVALRGALLANAESLGRVIGETLVAPLRHDDLWRAFELINAPFRTRAQGGPEFAAEVIVVLGAEARVFVSTDPRRFPVHTSPGFQSPDYDEIARRSRAAERFEPWSFEPEGGEHLHMVTPIVSDGVVLGTLVMSYSKSIFLPYYLGLARRATLVTLAGLAVVLPFAWWWALRVARPLVRLAGAMGQVGARLPEDRGLEVYESRDEIGQLVTAFRGMLSELREKEALEKQVMVSERLAALGRLAAGIAHEINNPLGGMLNAVNTFKRHGPSDLMTDKTVSLLERGLTQIKDTVAALLVEAKVESRPLTREDIEDTRTLVLAEAEEKHARVDWRNELDGPLPLPSTLVRQILINLLLNAVHAIEPRGSIACHTYARDGRLFMQVRNDGRHIPEERLPYLFEPFSAADNPGPGLGLWVTYQIVHQLDGGLAVTSEPGDTVFRVELPLPVES